MIIEQRSHHELPSYPWGPMCPKEEKIRKKQEDEPKNKEETKTSNKNTLLLISTFVVENFVLLDLEGGEKRKWRR